MISYIKGDIFDSSAQVLTNAVNCEGAMGKGIAREFRERYPEMYYDYRLRCARGSVRIGEPYLWEDGEIRILNFPTKQTWRADSQIEYIEHGLIWLTRTYRSLGISTIALPALGCGNGGLDWEEVRPLIERYLGELPDLGVECYLPDGERKR